MLPTAPEANFHPSNCPDGLSKMSHQTKSNAELKLRPISFPAFFYSCHLSHPCYPWT